MSDRYPIPEAVRLSNALDNLGSAAMAIEGATYNAEAALVALVSGIYSMGDPGEFAEILGSIEVRHLATIIKAMDRFNKPASFIEEIYSRRTDA